MSDTDKNAIVTHGIHRRHTIMGTICAVLSLGIHVLLLVAILSTPYALPMVRPLPDDELPPSRFQMPEFRQVEPKRVHDAPAETPTAKTGLAMTSLAGQLETAPDVEAIAPPDITPADAGIEAPPLESPTVSPEPAPWEARQDILMVTKAIVPDESATISRRRIEKIERVSQASDIVYPVDRGLLEASASLAGGAPEQNEPGLAELIDRAVEPRIAAKPQVTIGEKDAERGSDLFVESAEEITPLRALDDVLTAGLTTYVDDRDDHFGYFRVDVNPQSEKALPVIPKDVLFMQDASASIAEQRLYFCRQALLQGLTTLGPDDRFNIVSFSDAARYCFETWVPNSDANRRRATEFIDAMRSEGSTDIYESIRTLADVERQPGRPVIVFLVTDGHATTGLTDGDAIIRRFSAENDGAVSVFTMGTIKTAYTYMLDLLSYCNRGETYLPEGGRWGIPEAMDALVSRVRDPVLANLGLRVAAGTPAEVYPVQTMNLYRNQPLTFYGRYPRDATRVIFQATGDAGDARCDMIFELSLRPEESARGGRDIREAWAKQKVYYLLGQHARLGDPALIDQARETAQTYRVPIPHRSAF
ncbi:MAG: VWA domain-containing protein [Verrucomicrobia bacterium]|nr:VWA domain-containing protein [Verrucomicrobiota bacterium]